MNFMLVGTERECGYKQKGKNMKERFAVVLTKGNTETVISKEFTLTRAKKIAQNYRNSSEYNGGLITVEDIERVPKRLVFAITN